MREDRSVRPHRYALRVTPGWSWPPAVEVENPFACPTDGMMQERRGAFGIWPLDCANAVIKGLQVTCNAPTEPLAEQP